MQTGVLQQYLNGRMGKVFERKEKKEYDIFISYRRDGGEYTAKILRDSLKELGYRVFFDVESLRSGDFNAALYSVIDKCSDFIIILSPNALDRCKNEDDWVRRELEHAFEKGKNIVPILVKGFVFPDTLPESIEPIRKQNGLEASTQFFDAFVERLQNFLKAKPVLKVRTKKIRIISCVALLCAVIAAAGTYFGIQRSAYPFTNSEKNLTKEVIYCIEKNTTMLDMMAGALYDVYNQCDRYLNANGDANPSELSNKFQQGYQTLANISTDDGVPSSDMMQRMSDSPFSTADLTAMCDVISHFKKSAVKNISYMEWVTGDAMLMSSEYKKRILENYRTILENDLLAHAYGINQMLLPIKKETELKQFKNEYLPQLTYIPLKATDWSYDYDSLDSNMEKCMNQETNAIMELNSIVGNTTVENEMFRAMLVLNYMQSGYSREEALQIVTGMSIE